MSQSTKAGYGSIPRRTDSRYRLQQILDTAHSGDVVSRIVDIVLVSLISVSVIAVILESVPAIELKYSGFFYWLEVVTVAIFTVEYVLRIWCAVDADKYAGSGMGPLEIRLRFILSPYAIVDVLAILPFYLVMGGLFPNIDMRFLRCIRLLRILKLTRYSSAFDTLIGTCRDNARPLMAAFFVLITVMLLAASGMYFFERQAQPVAFASIPDAMWWAVSTLTTVGYGDVTPSTTGGKIFGAVITVIGVGMVALPTGILASGYSTLSREQLRQYTREASHALEDGVVSAEESSHLEKLRVDLSLAKHTASRILDEERVKRALAQDSGSGSCPHCGYPPPSDR